jgi:hypothetical protein
MYEDGNKVIGYKQTIADLKGDGGLGNELFLDIQDIQICRFPATLDQLKLALAKYLNFHNAG